MKKIISCFLSIVLALQFLSTVSFGVLADETNEYSTCYVKFALDDSTEYIKTIIKDECLMVNAQWLSGSLGLEYKTKSDFLNSAADLGNTLVSPITDKYNYFAEKLGAEDVTIFKNDVERFTISKRDSNLKFTFEVGKSTAAATSRAYGKMSVDLGTEVTAIEDEEGHKQYYVPLFMVCNIFNVVYYIEPQDEGNCIVLTAPQLTVVDIMHMQYKLEQYKTSNCLYDALNNDFLTRLEMVIPGTVDNALEYILSSKWLETPIGLAKDTFLSYLNTKDKSDRFWWLFDTAFDIAEYAADVKDEIKDPSFIYAGNYEMITCQMCSSDTNEIESMIGDSSDKLNTVIDGYSEFYGKMIEQVKKSCESGFLKKKTDLYEEILNYDNKISLFEFEKCYDKYNNLVAVNKVAKVSEVLNTSAATAASVLFEDIALKAEISAVQDEYVENMKTYLKYADSYVTEENRGEHVYIKRRIDLYESSTTDVFGDIASKSIATESIDSISGKICDFQLGKLSLAHGITKWGVNELTDGAFDFKDAYFNCLCCLEFRNATKTVLDQYMTIESSFDIETYRDLEWIRLKSYYVANKNELDMYAQYCSVAEETAKSNRTLAELREIGLEEKENYTNAEKAEFAKRIKEKDVNFEIDIDGAFEDYYIMTEAQNIYNNEKSVIDLETRELSEYMAVLLYGVEGTTPEYIALCEEYAQSDNEYVIENDCALYQQIECTVVDSEDNVGVVGAELEFSAENGVKALGETGEEGQVIDRDFYAPVGLYSLKVTASGYNDYEHEGKIEVKTDEICELGEIILKPVLLQTPEIKTIERYKAAEGKYLKIEWNSVEKAEAYEISYDITVGEEIFQHVETTTENNCWENGSAPLFMIENFCVRAYTTANEKKIYSEWSQPVSGSNKILEADPNMVYIGEEINDGITFSYELTIRKDGTAFDVLVSTSQNQKEECELPIDKLANDIYSYSNGSCFYRNAVSGGSIYTADDLSGTIEVNADGTLTWNNGENVIILQEKTFTDILLPNLAKMKMSEIIELMGGEYSVESYIDGFWEISNDKVFPNISFCVRYDAYSGKSELDKKLKNDQISLDAIQVRRRKSDSSTNLRYMITDKISMEYDYIQCAEILGEFSCRISSGGWIGGTPEAVAYSFEENECNITLHFYDKSLVNPVKNVAEQPASAMRKYNPQIDTVVIRAIKSSDDQEIDVTPSVLLKEVSASSELATQTYGDKTYAYSPQKAVDNDMSTCWSEGTDGYGNGESITLSFDKVYEINEICIWNGLCAEEDLFYKNSRLREISITFSDGQSIDYECSDGWNNKRNVITLTNAVETSSITITIKSVYEGEKYKDTCISEISVS